MYFAIYLKSNSALIQRNVTNAVPYILLINHSILFIAFLIFKKRDKVSFKSLGFSKKNLISQALFGVIAGIILFLFSHFILTPFFDAIGIKSGPFQPDKTFPIALFFLQSIIVASIVEESIYRGYAIIVLERKYGIIPAVLISSFFFSLIHFGEGIYGMATTFILGALYAFLYVKIRSLIVNMAAHGIANAGELFLFILEAFYSIRI